MALLRFTSYEGQAVPTVLRYIFEDKNTQDERWRRLVEAMGIEPMSAEQVTPSTTCLFFDYTHTTAAKTQHYDIRQLVILI